MSEQQEPTRQEIIANLIVMSKGKPSVNGMKPQQLMQLLKTKIFTVPTN